ncbi:MAG TPA: hypothetical protein VNH18_17730, partial [Bryobacteraceae bacterium]|nr:hypothetical protein [Bryobacteraceae bacterium]
CLPVDMFGLGYHPPFTVPATLLRLLRAVAELALRQKPESPRSRIFTSGHAVRICATIRLISLTISSSSASFQNVIFL